MINPKYINELIKSLPDIFIYIVPGYIFLKSFNYVLNWKNENISKNILECIMISFVICILTRNFLGLFYSEVLINLPEVIISILIFSGLLGYSIANFVKSKSYDVIRKKLKINRTINSNILNDIFDKNGTYVRVYLKEDKLVYYGSIVMIDQKNKYDDGFIVINNYCVYEYYENNIIEEALQVDEKRNYFASIKISEISRIETIYDENSSWLASILEEGEVE